MAGKGKKVVMLFDQRNRWQLDFSNTKGIVSEDCGLDLGFPGETIVFRVVWVGYISHNSVSCSYKWRRLSICSFDQITSLRFPPFQPCFI
jgi:hypothetical protein